MSDLEVGAEVQLVDYETDEVYDGVITTIIAPARQRPANEWDYTEEELADTVTMANVKYDDGSEETINIEALQERDSELEREFRVSASKALKQIHVKLEEASDALAAAVDLSEKYGIPFSTQISFLGQSYTPDSLEEKFEDLDKDFVNCITGASNEYGYAGWEHSAVC